MPYQSNVPPISDISVISVQGSYRRIWHNVCFLFVLSGEVRVEVDGHATYLNRNDIMMVEADTPYAVTGQGSNLVMVIRMNYDFFAQGKAGHGLGVLVCNSAEDNERDYTMLRNMLSFVALNYFESEDTTGLRLLELCYSLLYYLNTTHLVEFEPELSGEQADVRRGRQIISYIESNYMHELQLEDLAQMTYLSPSYFSRMFKKVTGMNFKSYLQEVRLRHAVEDMRKPGLSITAIAYNNGFPNVTSLNTAIHRKYDMTPIEFRRTLAEKQSEETEPAPYHVVQYDEVRTNLQILAGSESPKAMGVYNYPDRIQYSINDVSRVKPIKPIWRTMINVGTVQGMDSVGMSAQLRLMQDEIGFSYARLERVLTEEAIPMMEDGKYNFTYFDRTIELLMSLKMTPFLDLSLKGDYLLLSQSKVIFRGERPKSQPTSQSFITKVSALLRHCINTFGANIVETWRVEIGAMHDEHLNFQEEPEVYAARFASVYRMIKNWLPNMMVGGPDHNIAVGEELYKRAIELLQKEGVMFDFFSLCAVPHTRAFLPDGKSHMVVSPNPDYVRDCVKGVRDTLDRFGLQHVPIWVTAFGPNVHTRNHVSDSCYQATFIVKNTIDLIGLVDAIGYWQLSDIDTEYIDTPRILFGGTGILTRDGLKKPGFTALKRLSSIDTMMVEKTGNLLLTTNAINTYNIVLYNYAHFNHVYCLSGGDVVTYDNVYSTFDNAATRDISVSLKGLCTGRYKVITTTINRESGSLFDEWLRYGIIDELQPHDIRYLQDIVHPNRAVHYQECEDGSMELTMQMLPHEVKFLTLIREL